MCMTVIMWYSLFVGSKLDIYIMDIFQKYNEENPEAPAQTFQCDPSDEYGALTCTVIRMSGGRIQNMQEANKVLIGITVVIFLITFFVLAKNLNLLPAERFSAKDAAKQLEEYRKIQPF